MIHRTKPDWDPRSLAVRRDPLAAFDAMREKQSVAYSDFLGWSIFRHADVLRVLRDPANFSSRVSRHVSVPSGMDPPQHGAFRELVESFFSPPRMTAFEPMCRELVFQLVESLRRDSCIEWMERAATPLAVDMQCGFLRWPASMQRQLSSWMRENQAAIFAEDQDRLSQLACRFVEAVRDVVRNRDDSIEDITAELLRANVHGRSLHEDELVSILRNWTAGEVGTMSAAFGIVARYLAENQDLQRLLRAEPHRIPYAIDEILRIEGPLVSNRRVTTQAVEFDARQIPAGQRITVIWLAANRDGRVFEEPTRFRWNRDRALNLLYGAGLHYCPGAPLARLELRVFVEELLAATIAIKLGPGSCEPATYPAGGYSRATLSVTWR